MDKEDHTENVELVDSALDIAKRRAKIANVFKNSIDVAHSENRQS